MNNFIWKNKFIAINILALAIIKLGFAYPPGDLLGLISGAVPFSRSEVTLETNAFRTSLGLVALHENEQLNQAAEKKLRDMTEKQYFAHFSPSGTSPWYWFGANNYQYSYAGENLAFGFEDRTEMLNAWANSPSHRRNLVNPNYKDIGIAVGRASIGGAESVIVVQLFGAPADVRPATIAQVTPTPPAITTRPAPTITRIISPTPMAIPVPKISVFIPAKITPLPTTSLAPSPIAVRGTETTLPVELPTLVTLPEKYEGILGALNNGFAVYSALLVILALRLFWTATNRKELAGRTAIYGALCLAALFLSPVEITRTALIF